MRILHCCLSCFYIDKYNYQENVLPRQNKLDGHEVMILASTETFIDNDKLGYIKPGEYFNDDGIKVIRIPYRSILPPFIMKKLRIYKNAIKYVEKFSPDVIFFHGASAYEIITVAKYKAKHTRVKLFVDSHEDFNNSARNVISKNILHRLFYKNFIQRALPSIEKLLYISTESHDFMENFYEIPDSKLEFYPLGGTIIDGNDYLIRRKKVRSDLQLKDTDIMFVHSGKMDQLKRTSHILKAFKEITSEKFKLILLGSIPEDMKNELFSFIEKDDRVNFLGWKSTEDLYDYLCAADMYLQPGSQSATMQNAICCGCPVMLYPHKSHEPYLKDNGFYVDSVEDINNVFRKIDKSPEILKKMSEASYKIAYDLLDYRKLAARLYD